MQVPEAVGSLGPPPLFVAMTNHEGRRITHVFYADKSPDGIGGKWHCEAFAPSGLSASGVCAFEDVSESSVAYDAILRLFAHADASSFWFGSHTGPEGSYDINLSGVAVWSGRERIAPTAWRLIRDKDNEPLLVVQTRETDLTLEIPAAGGLPLFMPFQSQDHLHVRITEPDGGRREHWRVVSEPGFATAYWSFYRNGNLDAASMLAQRLVEALEEGVEQGALPSASTGEIVGAAHAAASMRSLGRRFRERVQTVLAAVDIDHIDIAAIRWILRFDQPGRYEPEAMEQLRAISLRLVAGEVPFHTEILRLLYERYPVAVSGEYAPSPADPVLSEGLYVVSRFAEAAEWGFDTLAYHANAAFEPVEGIEWDEIEAFVSAEKKSRRPQDVEDRPSSSRQRRPEVNPKREALTRYLTTVAAKRFPTGQRLPWPSTGDAVKASRIYSSVGLSSKLPSEEVGRKAGEGSARVQQTRGRIIGKYGRVRVILETARPGMDMANSYVVAALLVETGLAGQVHAEVSGQGSPDDIRKATIVALRLLKHDMIRDDVADRGQRARAMGTPPRPYMNVRAD